jgi:hypothetical protein
MLGIPLIHGVGKTVEGSPSLDRKNTAEGYTLENIWVISWRANRLKSNATREEIALLLQNWPK